MDAKPTIRLWALKGIGLIIAHPSGVLYGNQTGGHANFHMALEGVFVPLMDPGDADTYRAKLSGEFVDQQSALDAYFMGPKWEGYCDAWIDDETADFVDKVLAGSTATRRLKVDRDRMADSHEAWIHVVVPADDGYQLYEGFPGGPGVLTWQNSD
jgi:hypothetical protein